MTGDIAARYSRSADTYESMWSPIIRPMAAPLLEAIPASNGPVLDVGCGVGALFGDLARIGSPVVGLDRSEGMLRRAAGRAPVACADAAMLPVAAGAASVATAIFMLQHVPDPAAAIDAMAAAVRPGGFVATATWGENDAHEASEVWDALLDEHGAPQFPPLPDSRTLMNTPEKAAGLMRRSGMTVERCWVAPGEHRYTLDELVALHESYGRRNERLLALEEDRRAAVVASFRDAVAARPDLLVWRPGVVYAVARR